MINIIPTILEFQIITLNRNFFTLLDKISKQLDDVSVKVSDWYSALNNQIPNYHILYKILYFNFEDYDKHNIN